MGSTRGRAARESLLAVVGCDTVAKLLLAQEGKSMAMQKIRKVIRTGILVGLVTVATVGAGAKDGHAQENQLGFGTDLGFISGTSDGTVFALGFNLDYYLAQAFSVGPMLLLAPAGDLTEVAVAGVARFHIPLGAIRIVPFAGLGFVHADLDRGSGAGRVDESDTSHYIPLGVTAEFPLNSNLALASTLIINLHDLDLKPGVVEDDVSVALLFGIRFEP